MLLFYLIHFLEMNKINGGNDKGFDKGFDEVSDEVSDEGFKEEFYITVLDLNGKKYMVHCFGNSHSLIIDHIKFILGIQLYINKNDILLYLNDKKLTDYQTFNECKIDKNTKLRMYFKMKTGLIGT